MLRTSLASDDAMPGRVGSYVPARVIARGSLPVLYESEDPVTHRRVVLKTVRRDWPEVAADDFLARLRIEAEVACALNHTGIAAVYGYGEDSEHAYIAMECVEGRSLQHILDSGVPISAGRAVDLVSQLLEAVQYAHDHGVWHRDIKPANIIITPDWRVKLTDFGIAQAACSRTGAELEPIMGTPGFVAPETYLTDAFDGRVDVFAVGAVLYQVLAGVPAFAGRADEVMFKVCNETPPAPSIVAMAPSLQRFDDVVLKALARNPDDRLQSAAAFRSELLRAFNSVR
jgi:serine/threonine-protein kinase